MTLTTDIVDAIVAEGARMFTRRTPGGEVLDRQGMTFRAGAHSGPWMVNAAVRTDPRADPEGLLETADAFFDARGHRFSVETIAERDADLEAVLRKAGWRVGIELPAMVATSRGEDPALPEGATLEPVADTPGVHSLAGIFGHAFGPEEPWPSIFESLFQEPESTRGPDAIAWLVRLDGRPAAGAVGYLTADGGDLGFLGVRWDSMRHGLGEAIARVTVNALFDGGAAAVALQSSPMAAPVYRRIGFQQVGLYRIWARPEDLGPFGT